MESVKESRVGHTPEPTIDVELDTPVLVAIEESIRTVYRTIWLEIVRRKQSTNVTVIVVEGGSRIEVVAEKSRRQLGKKSG